MVFFLYIFVAKASLGLLVRQSSSLFFSCVLFSSLSVMVFHVLHSERIQR